MTPKQQAELLKLMSDYGLSFEDAKTVVTNK